MDVAMFAMRLLIKGYQDVDPTKLDLSVSLSCCGGGDMNIELFATQELSKFYSLAPLTFR